MSEQSNGELTAAQAHALACFNVLTKHFQEPHKCACWVDSSGEFPVYVAAESCLPGLNAREEYEIATDRVLELKALKPKTPR